MSDIRVLIITALSLFLNIYSWLIIARIFMSWFRGSAATAIGRFIIDITEPGYRFVQSLVPPIGGIDLTGLWIILICDLLRSLLVKI